jgi:predicted nucleic acid-binding protein
MAEQVIDASVAIQLVVQGDKLRTEALRLLADARVNGIDLIGPPLLEYEAESMLQRRLFHKQATIAVIDGSITAFYAVGFGIETHPDMVKRAREIARRCNQVRIYDSLYAALAELRGCEMWTADDRFFNGASANLSFLKHLRNYP